MFIIFTMINMFIMFVMFITFITFKFFTRVIMGNDYVDCAHWLNELKIADLTQRRYKVITNMALKIAKHQKVREMLPLRKELRDLKRRHTEKYEGWKATHRDLKHQQFLTC